MAKLPQEPSQQPINEVATLLHVFVADLAKHIAGVPNEDGLIQSIRPAQERFRREIHFTAPRFRPYEKKYAGTRKMPRVDFLDHEGAEVSEEEDGDVQIANAGHKRKKPVAGDIYVDEVFERAQKYDPHLVFECCIYLCYRRARTRELPGNYPFVAQQTYINDFVKEWRGPAQTLRKNVYNTLLEYLKVMVHKHFATFGQGVLEHRVRYVFHS